MPYHAIHLNASMSRWFFILPVVCFAGALCVPAQTPQAPNPASSAEREAHWRQDLQFLSNGLKAPGFDFAAGLATRGQKDFASLYPNFDTEIASLEADLPRLSDTEVLLRLMRLMASSHVAHNTVEYPKGMGFLNHLPFFFQWFPDGLIVIAAAPEYSAALGARVVAFGNEDPETFLRDLEPYVSHENDAFLRQQAPNLMVARGVLEHFKLIDADGRVLMKLVTPGGKPLTVEAAFVEGPVKEVSMLETLNLPPALHLSNRAAYYWFRDLPDSETLFIQYNRCENDPNLHFREFARQVLDDADTHSLKRVVIDLRRNGGGDAAIINPLKDGLAARRARVGKVYVLIGPGTFSSGVDDAVNLRRDLSAVLVGSPTGGKPGGYGEVGRLRLPNSKLVVRFSRKHWGPGGNSGPATLEPDLPAPLTLADVLAGRDPALAAAIHAN